MRAVAAHHVPGPQPLFPPRRPDREVDSPGILPYPCHLVTPKNLPAESAQRPLQKAFGLVLREHQRVGVRCGEPPERHRKQASIPVANAEVGYQDASTHRFVHYADRLQSLERPRVYDRRAGMPRGPLGAVQHDGPDPVRGEHGSCREPDRPRPDHGDFYLVLVGLRTGGE